MINSLSYYEFEGSYVGLDGYSGSVYWEEYYWMYDFYDEELNNFYILVDHIKE